MFDVITDLIATTGYGGIALLMLAENLFPPIPSELVMPLAGFTAARGELDIRLVILAGTIGALAGAVFWYWVGRAVGSARLRRWAGAHGRWMAMTPEDVERAERVFTRHRAGAVFLGRMIPAIRTLISVPAGITRMPLPLFLVWTALGTSLWTAFLAGAGYVLEGGYERVAEWTNPVSNLVVALLAAWYVYRVATFGRRPA